MQKFQSVLHAIANYAMTVPEKVAIIEAESDRRCTYSELWAYVKAFSRQLISIGVNQDSGDGYGTRVVVRCTQTVDYMVAALAIQLAGGVFVPVEKNIAEMRIIEIMKETDSNIFISSVPLSVSDYIYISLADATKEKVSTEDKEIAFPIPDSLTHILFTTGTTGESKGIMVSQKSSTARILAAYSACHYDDKQVLLIPAPLSHVTGLRRTYVSLFYQCTTVLLDGYVFAASFFSAIKKYGVTVLTLMSAATEIYLRMYRDKLEEIRGQINYISLGGSSYPDTQIKSLKTIFNKSKIIKLYGATEIPGCSIDYTVNNCTACCIGKPLLGIETVFFDEQKEHIIEATKENPGLFAMKGDAKMDGYWRKPELTASVTKEGYIILSDLGYVDGDGLLYFIGRADDVIISGGYKVAPLEIEEVANSFKGIRESACVAVSDPIMGQVPKLYVVMEDNYFFDFTEIHKHLKDKLETTRIPRHIEKIDKIPRINNKINRKELKNK